MKKISFSSDQCFMIMSSILFCQYLIMPDDQKKIKRIKGISSPSHISVDMSFLTKKRAKIEKEKKMIRLEHRQTFLNILDYLYCNLLAMGRFSYWEHN